MDLTTSQRYMHLGPAALDSAIRLLDEPAFAKFRGDMLETGIGLENKATSEKDLIGGEAGIRNRRGLSRNRLMARDFWRQTRLRQHVSCHRDQLTGVRPIASLCTGSWRHFGDAQTVRLGLDCTCSRWPA